MKSELLNKKALGVDIGGTKIAAALIDINGEISHRKEVASDIVSAESMFNVLTEVIDNVLQSADLAPEHLVGIGIGLPGKVDSKNGIAVFQNNLPWGNFPVVQRLQTVYGITNIVIDNDVKVAAFAEYQSAQLESDAIFGYMTISTGIASTIIVDNKILRGAGFSGEIGYLPVQYDNRKESLEMFAAGPAIQNTGRDLYQDNTLTAADIFSKWEQGEELATQIVEASIQEVAKAIYHTICLLDPAKFVLGGSVAVKNPLYLPELKKHLTKWLYPDQYHILDEISVSTLGSDNGIMGAGWLAFNS